MENYLYLYNRFYSLVNLGFASGISVRVSMEFLDLAYFPRIDYFAYSSYFWTDYFVHFYFLFSEQIENRLLLCDLFSDRFYILLVLLVLGLFYLFLQIVGYYVMILQFLGIVNVVCFLFAVRFWLFNSLLLVLLFLLFRQIYQLFLFVFLMLVLGLEEHNRSRLFPDFFQILHLICHYYFVYDIRRFLLLFLVFVLHRMNHFHFPTYIFYLNLLVIGIRFLKGQKFF